MAVLSKSQSSRTEAHQRAATNLVESRIELDITPMRSATQGHITKFAEEPQNGPGKGVSFGGPF